MRVLFDRNKLDPATVAQTHRTDYQKAGVVVGQNHFVAMQEKQWKFQP